MATGKHHGWVVRGLVTILLLVLLHVPAQVHGQEGSQGDVTPDAPESGETVRQPAVATPHLYITDSESPSPPTISLRAYGMTEAGIPMILPDQSLVIRHNGVPVESIDFGSQEAVGTFTLFLIDVTPGVAAQVPVLQQLIEQFASPDYMQEQLDAVTIYRVGESDAQQLLAPTPFHNSVRNFFASPLEPQSGPTALIDSLVGLLDNMASITPDANQYASIVVFSDGTDAVSTQFQLDDVAPRAAELGIPLHTVWMQNEDLTVGAEVGRNYLAQVARDAYGVAGRLDQTETVAAIFDRIISFRSQQRLQYAAPEVSAGAATVTLSLLNNPEVQATTEVSISPNAPSVTLNVPPDSRSLRLPSLDEPITIALSGAVTWLDGTERTLQQAQLWVNGQLIAEVPVNDLDRFEVPISNFTYGDNDVSLLVTDEQGLRAVSPPVVISVIEGETEIPESLQPSAGFLASVLPYCFGGLLLLAVLSLGGLWAFRSGRLAGIGRSRRAQPPATADEGEIPQVAEPTGRTPAASGPGQAYLEVIESATQMPGHIPLQGEETRLGRSPNLADVAFEQDITVSRLHASILWDGHSYRLYDDDSTSGTWINDQEVPPYGIQLFDGDEIFLGKVQLRFRHR